MADKLFLEPQPMDDVLSDLNKPHSMGVCIFLFDHLIFHRQQLLPFNTMEVLLLVLILEPQQVRRVIYFLYNM